MERSAAQLDYSQDALNEMNKDALLELFNSNISNDVVGKTDHQLNTLTMRILKALRVHADPDNKHEYKTSSFLNLNIKDDPGTTYNPVQKKEVMA